jgi:hypothetical protein
MLLYSHIIHRLHVGYARNSCNPGWQPNQALLHKALVLPGTTRVHVQVQLLRELCDVLQRFSTSLLCDGDASQQQQQQAATEAAAADPNAVPWMLSASELALQCIANMAATHHGVAVEATAVAGGVPSHSAATLHSASCVAEDWAAAIELMCALESQLDGDSSRYASMSGVVQMVKTRLSGNA